MSGILGGGAISLFVSDSVVEIASWRQGATRNDANTDFFISLLDVQIPSYADSTMEKLP